MRHRVTNYVVRLSRTFSFLLASASKWNTYLISDCYNFMLMKHFSNAGFPCPIMQSPSDHFLRAINTDFDRIIAMCKNWQVIISSGLMIAVLIALLMLQIRLFL